ncbi:MAG: NUDIX hydrolase [Candidatus Peregrinibacteria bacterium]|nr:NUDIX hydrolase [Candidatus Peregrinibacteria bacterium]
MKKFKILSSEKLVDEQYCPIEKQLVELPNGDQTYWFVNNTPDAVIVIAFLSDGQVLLQKNYKHGSGEFITEFTAGMIDSGETPADCAKRELLEETGHSAESFEKIGESFANPTGSPMKYHFFVAKNCHKTGEQNLDQSEQIEVFFAQNTEEARNILTNPKNHTSAASLALLALI